jgi:hypothetical protein
LGLEREMKEGVVKQPVGRPKKNCAHSSFNKDG